MSNFKICIPKEVQDIIAVIEEHGYQAYAVGGCVRDSMLKRTPDDWDITTSALPKQVKDLFRRTVDTGIKHGTVTVMFDKNGYEVTTYRIDGEYKDGRHPDSVEFSAKLVDDLKRRDFTINAMAYNDKDGLIDEFNGIDDLKNGIIRCVGNPKERFGEDALRMMRAVRFSAQLGFEIEADTYNAIKELAPSIKQVSMERVQVELVKTLTSDNPDYVVLYRETGLFEDILPEIHNLLSGKYSENALTMLKLTENTPVLRYAALLNMVEADKVKQTLKSLKLDNYTIDTATKLVRTSKDTIEENEPAVREAIHRYGREFMPLMFKHSMAMIDTSEKITGISMAAKRRHLKVICHMYDEIIKRGDCIAIKDLDITGNDLIEYGLSGPKIGEMLEKLLHVVIENPKMNDKVTLIEIVNNLQQI